MTARRRAWAPLVALASVLLLPATAIAGTDLPRPFPVPATYGRSVADPAAPAQSQDLRGIAVLLDEVDPVVAHPGEPVILRGRLVNQGESARRLDGVTLRASSAPLRTRTEMAAWLDGSVVRDTTWVLGDDAVGPVLAPGAETEYAVTVPASALAELDTEPTTLAVELLAAPGAPAPDLSGTAEDDGLLRTVLTVTPDREVLTPLDVSWVVPLALPPDPDLVNPDPGVHAEAWLSAVGPDSSLRRWLEHLDLPDVTYVVDPEAVLPHRPAFALAVAPPPEPEEEPTDEPEPTGTDDDDAVGTTGPGGDDDTAVTTAPAPPTEPGPTADQPGTTAEPPDGGTAPTGTDVAATVEDLREMLAGLPGGRLWWLPAGDPDLALVLDQEPTEQTVDRLLSPPNPDDASEDLLALLEQGRQGVAWPVVAPTDADVDALAGMFAAHGAEPLSTLVTSREAITGSSATGPGSGVVPVYGDDVVALTADSWMSGLVGGSGDAAARYGPGAAAQHLLAQTMISYLEGAGTERELVIAPPRGTDLPVPLLDQVSLGWERASWLTDVPAEELLDRATERPVAQLTGISPQEEILGDLATYFIPPGSPVDASRGRNLEELAADLSGLGEVLQDTEALRSWRPVLLDLWSTRWRAGPEAWADLWREVREQVRVTRNGVHVTSSTVNFVTDQGTMHITVVNELPVAVEDVRLRVQPDNARLQIIRQPEPFAIGPGSRATVSLEARAITRGTTVLGTELATPSGTMLGEEEMVEVRVQPTGVWIYWVLGVLAGGVLILGLARALRGSRRRPRAYPPDPAGASSPDTPSSDTESSS